MIANLKIFELEVEDSRLSKDINQYYGVEVSRLVLYNFIARKKRKVALDSSLRYGSDCLYEKLYISES